MSLSYSNLKSTRAGVALSVVAKRKLQQLADWMELEIEEQQDPRVRLAFHGGVVSMHGVTSVSPLGALVQMFQPFKLSEATKLGHGLYKASPGDLVNRATNILGVSSWGLNMVIQYMYCEGYGSSDVVRTLRNLR